MIEDKRNWKCFIGMHQYMNKYRYANTRYDQIIGYTVILRCEFCGKLKKREF